MPALRDDCHITLAHPAVNAGQPVGFILEEGDDRRGPAVSVEREVISGGRMVVRFFFNVLLADDLLNPDGSLHASGKAAMYTLLLQFLGQNRGIVLETPAGVYSDVGAVGHAATEFHYGRVSIVSVQLNNAGDYFPPADPLLFNNSLWDGPLAWENSYWR